MPDVLDVFRIGSWRVRFQLVGIWISGAVIIVSALWCIAKIILIATDPRYAPQEPVKEPEINAPFTYVYEVKEISIPILSKQKNRVMYARFSLTLDCPSAKAKAELEKGKSRIMDAILEVTSGLYEEDFKAKNGFNHFKEIILKAIATRFPKYEPRQLSIEDWIIG